MLPLEVMLSMTLPSCANLREHWRVRAKRVKEQRQLAAYAVLVGEQTEKVTFPKDRNLIVTLHRVGKRKLDDDNLASAFKAMRDGVADALKIKDNDPRIAWKYDQTTGKSPAVVIRIEEAP